MTLLQKSITYGDGDGGGGGGGGYCTICNAAQANVKRQLNNFDVSLHAISIAGCSLLLLLPEVMLLITSSLNCQARGQHSTAECLGASVLQ
jgi:hypothetical protein